METRLLKYKDLNRGYLDLMKELLGEKVDEKYFQEIVSRIDSNNQILVIKKDKEIIATGTIHFRLTMKGYIGYIDDVIVEPLSRGCGYGKKIVNELLERAKMKNCYKVVLNTNTDNISFYHKFGFKKYQHFLELRF